MPDESIRLVHASGECEIDLARRELRVLGSAVPIGGRAFEIIEVLAHSAGDLVTKNELMDRIWPGAVVMENTLAVHAAAVRKALGPHRSLLKTESGRGYRLIGDWSVQGQNAARPPVGVLRMRTDGESPVTNFPATVTRLVGRTGAVVRLRDLISAYRLVTLTGPGGHRQNQPCLEDRSWSRRCLRGRRLAGRACVTDGCRPCAAGGGGCDQAGGWNGQRHVRRGRTRHRGQAAAVGPRQLRASHRRGGDAGRNASGALPAYHDPGDQSRDPADPW
jgi:DNA-binding winged helix-turn-helix (wHTH) protein